MELGQFQRFLSCDLGNRVPHSPPPLFIYGSNLWPINTWLMINHSLSPAMGTQVIGERTNDHSSFFKLDRSIVGPWVPVPALCQGTFMKGRERPWNDRACPSTVWVLAKGYSCHTTTWTFICCVLEERNLERMLKMCGPKINRSREAAKGPRRGASQENQDQTLVHNVKLFL